MGRSAKFHKRQQKKTTSSAGSGSTSRSLQAIAPLKPAPKPAASAPTAKEQKKHAGLKAKASRHKRAEGDGPVLGGADYVTLMLGGRRRAAEEAAKLPKDPDS
ncbi:hypothetical protein C8Q74DRAFT_1369083 [Fomes fomentarius]|nr:hypothetical protein C8Q74DRAFT_1369083 [Fomes fomentarius]